jgi:hypothetical protein
MTLYRLPTSLGGTVAESIDQDDNLICFDFEGVNRVVWLPLSCLTEVKPPLPPEPPVFAVVLVAGRAYQRIGDRWCTHGEMPHTWDMICEMGTPQHVVFYEPVDLPWKGVSGLTVDLPPGEHPPVFISFGARGTTWAIHSVDDLRGAARALWTAADLQEGKQP